MRSISEWLIFDQFFFSPFNIWRIVVFIKEIDVPEHYGLSEEPDGCRACDCDIGGAVDNYCDDPLGWENVQLTIVRPSDPSPDGVCSNALPSDDFLIVRLHAGGRYAEVRPDVCLEAHVPYEIRLQMGEKRTGVQDRSASILIDSIVLVPPTDVLPIFKGSPVAEQHKYVATFF
uniref:Laminin IV type B domain-containing protein n=1 Tax=Parascaris equorum TaxID=6256 RepID=A0A914RWH3_PAREQ